MLVLASLKIHRQYGREAISRLKDNPYCLTEDIFGVGFLTADRLAQKLGLGRHARERLMAAALYVLGQAAGRGGGHCFLPAEELIQQTLKLVNASDEEEPVQAEEVEAALGELVQRWVKRSKRMKMVVAVLIPGRSGCSQGTGSTIR